MLVNGYRVSGAEENGRLVVRYAPLSGTGGGQFAVIIDDYLRGVLRDPAKRERYIGQCVPQRVK